VGSLKLGADVRAVRTGRTYGPYRTYGRQKMTPGRTARTCHPYNPEIVSRVQIV